MVGVLIALMISLVLPRAYTASTTLLLSPRTDAGLLLGEQRLELATEIEVLRSRAVQLRAERELGYQPTIDIRQVRASSAVDVTATARTAERAVQAADAFAAEFIALRREQTEAPLRAIRDEVSRKVAGLQVLAAAQGLTAEQLRSGAAALDDPDLARELAQLEASAPSSADEPRVSVAVLRLASLQRRLDEVDIALRALGADDPVVISAPKRPTSPSSPRLVVNILLGATLGAAGGLSLSLVAARRPRSRPAA